MKVKKLNIYTSNLNKQIDFYSNTIGLKLIEQTESEVKFQIGNSILKLVANDNSYPYHFAINIPANKETEALNWLKSRVTILKDGESEIQDFEFWNAKAIYFYDIDKNIVELIARKNLRNNIQEKFSINSLLEISEIGIPVSDIKATYKTLNELTNIEMYDGGFEKFCAIGDETGLFICIDKNSKGWFPTGDKAYASEFKIRFEENKAEYVLEFINEKIKKL